MAIQYRKIVHHLLITALAGAVVVACATSPLGRKQLKLLPDDQIQSMGVAAYKQIKNQLPQTENKQAKEYVQCVADAVVEAMGQPKRDEWEITVFEQEDPNAFALPGGKIGVHTGLLKVAENQSQLAAVIGHELSHVVAGHSNERVSAEFATQAGLDLLQVAVGGASTEQQQLFGLLGMGAQVGILLPYSRAHEREADLIGLDLMAKAGFDPRESVALWKNMMKASGDGPPEFLSTHPAGETRIEDLQERMDHAMKLYQQARAAGRTPNCQRPAA